MTYSINPLLPSSITYHWAWWFCTYTMQCDYMLNISLNIIKHVHSFLLMFLAHTRHFFIWLLKHMLINIQSRFLFSTFLYIVSDLINNIHVIFVVHFILSFIWLYGFFFGVEGGFILSSHDICLHFTERLHVDSTRQNLGHQKKRRKGRTFWQKNQAYNKVSNLTHCFLCSPTPGSTATFNCLSSTKSTVKMSDLRKHFTISIKVY